MNSANEFPVALLMNGKAGLSDKAREEIGSLKHRRPFAFIYQVIMAWLVIVAVVWWAVIAESLWISILAIFVVATRQNILGLLVHDQAHTTGFKAKGGDLFVNLVAGYPLLILTVEGYAKVHLSHHTYYFTDKDPDFIRKSGDAWSFPMPASRLAKLFLTDLLAMNLLTLIKGKKFDTPEFDRNTNTPAWVRPVFYVLLAALLTLTGSWDIFLIYWVLPLLTVMQVIIRWGAICEHKYNMPGAGIEENSPIIILSWWEKILLPNLNFTLHPYHHYFPGISFANLPKVHAIFVREGLVDESKIFYGYLAYLRYLTSVKTEVKQGVS